MTISEPRLRSLLVQANRNAGYGKRAAAETLYRQILDESPDAVDAWVGLGDVLVDENDKREAYEHALSIVPDQAAALAGLAVLNGEAPIEKTAEEMPPDEPVATATPVEKTVADMEEATLTDAEETHWHVESVQEPQEDTFTLTCYRHPDRSTSLRCYNCQKPICISCANKTPVGYICPDCLREAEDTFFNNKPTDYLIAALVSFPISLVAGFILVNFNFGFFFYIIIFLVSGAVGGFIGRITKRAIGNRRGRYLPQLVVAMMILGVLIPALPILLAVLAGNLGALTALIGPGIYLFVASSAAYWQMR